MSTASTSCRRQSRSADLAILDCLHFHQARAVAERPDLRLHDLRHTGATLAAATGACPAELMARMGHSTPDAAMRYQDAAQDCDAAIAEALSEFAASNVVSVAGERKAKVTATR